MMSMKWHVWPVPQQYNNDDNGDSNDGDEVTCMATITSATWQKIWGFGTVLNIWKKNLKPDLLIWNFWKVLISEKFWFLKNFWNSELFRSSEFKSESFRSSDLWSDYFQIFRFFVKLLIGITSICNITTILNLIITTLLNLIITTLLNLIITMLYLT